MIYRRLTSDDKTFLALVSAEYSKNNLVMPLLDDILVQIAVSDGGELKGFMVVQPQLHCEPLVLYDPRAYRGLIASLEQEVKQVISQGSLWATAKDRVAKMLEIVGFEQVPESLYRKIL